MFKVFLQVIFMPKLRKLNAVYEYFFYLSSRYIIKRLLELLRIGALERHILTILNFSKYFDFIAATLFLNIT